MTKQEKDKSTNNVMTKQEKDKSTNNAMTKQEKDKRTNCDLQNTTQRTIDRVTRTPHTNLEHAQL
jgi:hypothetical protein